MHDVQHTGTAAPMATLVLFVLLVTIALLPISAVLATACQTPLVVDARGGIIDLGVPSSVGGTVSRSGAQSFPVANSHVEVPQGARELIKNTMCIDVSAYTDLTFTLEPMVALSDLAWPGVTVVSYETLDQCQQGSEAPTAGTGFFDVRLDAFQQADGTFRLPPMVYGGNTPFIGQIKFSDFDQRTAMRIGPIQFDCATTEEPEPLPTNMTSSTTTTTATTTSTTTIVTTSMAGAASTTATACAGTTTHTTALTNARMHAQLPEHPAYPQHPKHPSAHPNYGPNYSANDWYGYGRSARPAATTPPPARPSIVIPSLPKHRTVNPAPTAASTTTLAHNPKFVASAPAAASTTTLAPNPKFVAAPPAVTSTTTLASNPKFVTAAPVAATTATTATFAKAQVMVRDVQARDATALVAQSQPHAERLVQHDADPTTSAAVAEPSVVASTPVPSSDSFDSAAFAAGAGVLVAAAVGAVMVIRQRRRRRLERGLPVETAIRP